MTDQDKELLLKDLSARTPYGVKIHLETPKYGELIGTLDAVYPTEERVIVDNLNKAIAPINVRCGGFLIERDDVKPYLRPMSSMTEEERNELSHYDNSVQRTDFFYSHHIDCRYMIEKGLALEAPEGMYNI